MSRIGDLAVALKDGKIEDVLDDLHQTDPERYAELLNSHENELESIGYIPDRQI